MAGNRAGLAGERSGLFMEQIRIVKEMREHDREQGRKGTDVRPRFMVWENVKGAFNSNKGKDFQAVLTEIFRIAVPDAPDVPMPDSGKWPYSGLLLDEVGGVSVAWRLHDAQYWGVPQRRERVAIVADFGGMSRNSDESGEARQGTPTGAESGTNRAVDVNEDRIISSTVGGYMQASENQVATLMARDFKDPQIIMRA